MVRRCGKSALTQAASFQPPKVSMTKTIAMPLPASDSGTPGLLAWPPAHSGAAGPASTAPVAASASAPPPTHPQPGAGTHDQRQAGHIERGEPGLRAHAFAQPAQVEPCEQHGPRDIERGPCGPSGSNCAM